MDQKRLSRKHGNRQLFGLNVPVWQIRINLCPIYCDWTLHSTQNYW